MTAACEEKTKASKIKVAENGKSAVILNGEREDFKKIKVDGCLVKNLTASDWVISKDKTGEVVIELKGCDVDHAVVQVMATIEHLTAFKLRTGKLGCLIVCSRYPKHDTKVQLAQQRIAKQFKAPLHVVSRNLEYAFEKLLSFDGPL
jgi:hypothetical protein